MAQFYAPNFSGLLPLFDGQSAAGGKLYAFRAGSSIPAPLFNEDGVELGSWVSIDSNGCADFLLDSALSYKLIAKDALGAVVGEWDNVKATNAPGGMDNPMTDPGDIIVGGTGGTATALPAGSEGQALKIVSGVPAWATDAEGMANPMTTEGDLIVGSTDGEPARLGVGAAGEVLTSDGTTWAPAAIPTQPGDHKTAVDGSDTSPDYLAAKLAAGSGISLTNTGSAVEIAATAQSGDHQLLVSATDAAAGYLGAKLTAGSNITITPQTDGDGVQTLELSATGGGGSVETMQENFSLLDSTDHYDTSTRSNRIYASKVVSNFTAKRTKLGIFHEAGTFGAVLLGVYDNSGNLLATTAAETPTSATFKKMRWLDTDAPFDMVAGEEYYFVAYFTEAPWSLTIDALGMEKTSTFDANFIGSASATAGLSALPATLPALTPDSLAFYIAAK